jgi:hypothetical protein
MGNTGDLLTQLFSAPAVQTAVGASVVDIVGAGTKNIVAQLQPAPVSMNTPLVIGSTAISPLVIVIGLGLVWFAVK